MTFTYGTQNFLITDLSNTYFFTIQTTCHVTTNNNNINTIESNKNNANKKVTEDDYVYVSDYLKHIREVENFDHYLLPQHNNFMGGAPSYDFAYPDLYPPVFNGPLYEPSQHLDYPMYDDHPTQSNFRELIQTTEFPSGLPLDSESNLNEEVEEREQPITFRYSGVRQLNYSVTSPESLQLIDVEYENDVYFLHNNVISRINLAENEAKFETVATIDDTHEAIKEAHVSVCV